MSPKPFLSPKEVGQVLGLSSSTVARRLRDRKIPSVKIGGVILVPAVFIEELQARAMASSPTDFPPSEGSRA